MNSGLDTSCFISIDHQLAQIQPSKIDETHRTVMKVLFTVDSWKIPYSSSELYSIKIEPCKNEKTNKIFNLVFRKSWILRFNRSYLRESNGCFLFIADLLNKFCLYVVWIIVRIYSLYNHINCAFHFLSARVLPG